MALLLLCASIFAFSAAAHAGELYVNVVDSFGYPLENVSVVITPVDLSEERKKAYRNKPFLIRRTDRLGRFLFVRIQPGKHVLTAKHRAGSSSRICYLVADTQIDYPENVESHSVEITLQSVRRYKVSGRVLGLGELTGQQLVIFFEPRAYPSEAKPPFTRMAVFIDSDGRFEIYVPGGRYELRLGTADRGMFEEIASTPGTLDISQDQEGLLLDRFQAMADPSSPP